MTVSRTPVGISGCHNCRRYSFDDVFLPPLTWNDPIVALFTSTSAVCVYGLAVEDVELIFFLGTILRCCLCIGGLDRR